MRISAGNYVLVVWFAEQSRKFLVVVQHPNIALRHVAVQFNQQMSHSAPHSTSVGVLQHVCVYLVDDGCSRIPATSVNSVCLACARHQLYSIGTMLSFPAGYQNAHEPLVEKPIAVYTFVDFPN